MDIWEYEIEARERDSKRKWWQAKECPGNMFEHAPIFFTVVIAGYVIAAGISAIAMLAPSVACAIGATSTWCH